jgi:hypothetical protein
MNCKIIIKISYLFKQRHSDNMYIFYNTNRDHIIKQLFNCLNHICSKSELFKVKIIYNVQYNSGSAFRNKTRVTCFVPYNILFRWRNMILALHRKWSHQYAYRWRTMILAIRSWFQVDYCLPYYVSILGCALSDLLSAILLD